MQCADAGLDVEWEESDVDMSGLEKAGEGEWEGVRRRYWTLDSKSFEGAAVLRYAVGTSNRL
ncbi:unnamed protein product [Fusarium graminearum]|nr:unnamed protein product [Fusarium graminearum]